MSSIEERRTAAGSTVWRVRFRDDGTNRAVTFASADDAQRWKALLDFHGPRHALTMMGTSAPAKGERTVAEHLAHHVEHLTGVTGGTRSDYATIAARSINPVLGDIPLSLLTHDDVARWVNAMTGVSGKTIRNRQGLLSAALGSAVRDGLIAGNVAKGVRLPRTDHQRVEMVTLTAAEFERLAALVDPDFRPLVWLLVLTGIRFGEATALTVADVDLGTRTARVRQAWKHTDGHGHELGPPKSRRSRRTVTLPAPVPAMLAPLLDRAPGEFLLTNRRGGPVRRSNFHGDVWTPAVRSFAGDTSRTMGGTGGRPQVVWTAGPGKRPRVHDLRHTFATWAIQGGASLMWVQRALGHESITTTVDTYGHITPADRDAFAETMGAMFAPRLGP